MAANFHEDLDRAAAVEISSDRSFGCIASMCLAALALWPLWAGRPPRLALLAFAALPVAVALLRPSLLHPLNVLWLRLGLLLGRIMNPAITGLLFFAVFTPVGILLRWRGKDPLRLEAAPDATSYWLDRRPPGPPPETMAKQF